MVSYDPNILQHFADRLYRKAHNLVGAFTLIGAIVGGFGGFVMGRSSGLAVAGMVICGLCGAVAGQARAFRLRLQAQLTLCQKSIEENTRRCAINGNAQATRPPTTRAA